MSRASRGRGGRGGKSSHAISSAKVLMKRSAVEAGLDDRHFLTIEEITNPPLFPDLLWHTSGQGDFDESITEALVATKRTASTIYVLHKQKEIEAEQQKSAHYVLTPQLDVIRYGKQKKPVDVAVLEQMGETLSRDTRYLPVELLAGVTHATKRAAGTNLDPTTPPRPSRRRSRIEELEEKERAVPNAPADEIDETEDLFGVEPVDEEPVEDYTMNYYESEDSSNGQDEATF